MSKPIDLSHSLSANLNTRIYNPFGKVVASNTNFNVRNMLESRLWDKLGLAIGTNLITQLETTLKLDTKCINQ